MDQRLQNKLDLWHRQIEEVQQKELTCLSLEANEKSLYGKLFLSAEGKTVSEKEAKTYSSQDWRDFQSGLVAARVEYTRAKRELELKQSAFQAEYLGSKLEGDAMGRMPRALT